MRFMSAYRRATRLCRDISKLFRNDLPVFRAAQAHQGCCLFGGGVGQVVLRMMHLGMVPLDSSFFRLLMLRGMEMLRTFDCFPLEHAARFRQKTR